MGELKKLVSTDKAPAAIGPYSQGVRVGGWLYISGQIPLDPATGKIVAGGIREQTGQALSNLQAVLESAGMGMSHVVKATVYLADMKDFSVVNEVYAESFKEEEVFPARAAVEVSALPKGARVEIEAVAYRG